MLRKKIDEKQKALNELRSKDEDFAKREEDLAKSIEEASTDEEKNVVEEAVNEFESEKKEHDEAKATLEKEVSDLEEELNQEEAEVEEPKPEEPKEEERKDEKKMEIRGLENIVLREDVKGWVNEIRESMKNKRALTNVGLTIPEVLLGVLRENVINYSKLYSHVRVVRVSGEARQIIMGNVPEAVWTECCANLNELNLGFNDLTVDCHKVGGFYAVCNANLEDSDIDLVNEIMIALGQAIGLALDKAILYGKGVGMPLGVVNRLVQTEQPSDYPATARTWEDLHTSNVITIPESATGVELFKQILLGAGNAKGKYARGEKVWAMNEKTYTALIGEGLTISANGAILSGVNGVMPVVGGVIEVLDFIPDNIIIGGYFELYLLAERAGRQFASSEHFRFLADQTVFKGTARYDGQPSIAEGFVAIGINGTTPTADMTFASDTANDGA